jgi:hypothetical protein
MTVNTAMPLVCLLVSDKNTSGTVVVHQHDNYGFSVPVGFRSKAQCEGNGHSLGKHCNAAAGHHRDALRVSLSTPSDCVPPLDKGMTIVGKARLAVNVDKLTESAIIMLMDY